ncbi:hypothetical protein LRP88_13360 [Fusarium phalaenopsidis]
MIQVVGAATAMHDILAWGVADPYDGVLTSRPVYGRFELDFGNKSQVRVVYASTEAENSFQDDVVEKFEEALIRSKKAGINVKMVLIVNPHNPLDLLHVTYGLSKDFGAAGLRVGAIITRSKPVLRAIEAAMRFHNPSGASLAIGSAMLENREWRHAFIEGSRAKLAQAYKHVTKGLTDIGIRYLPGSNAGFFVWIDLSPYLPSELGGERTREFALAKKLKEEGVIKRAIS